MLFQDSDQGFQINQFPSFVFPCCLWLQTIQFVQKHLMLLGQLTLPFEADLVFQDSKTKPFELRTLPQ